MSAPRIPPRPLRRAFLRGNAAGEGCHRVQRSKPESVFQRLRIASGRPQQRAAHVVARATRIPPACARRVGERRVLPARRGRRLLHGRAFGRVAKQRFPIRPARAFRLMIMFRVKFRYFKERQDCMQACTPKFSRASNVRVGFRAHRWSSATVWWRMFGERVAHLSSIHSQ